MDPSVASLRNTPATLTPAMEGAPAPARKVLSLEETGATGCAFGLLIHEVELLRVQTFDYVYAYDVVSIL